MKALNTLLAASLATGCSTDKPEIEAPPSTVSVSITTGGVPELVAYRDDASAEWTPVDVDGRRTFSIGVSGPYRLVVVCHVGSGIIAATQYARTIDDDVLIDQCQDEGGEFTVRGKVNAPGAALLGTAAAAAQTASWDFALAADAGTYDLAVLFGPLGAADHIALQRDVEVEDDVTLPAIDATGAVALVPTTFTPVNLAAGEQLEQRTQLRNATLHFDVRATFTPQASQTWATALVPASVLKASDHQSVRLTATSTTSNRTLSRTVARSVAVGVQTDVKLPEPLGAVTLENAAGKLTTSLAGLPTDADLTLWQESYPEDTKAAIYQETQLSHRYLAAVKPTSAVVDFTGVPDFDASWQIDTAGHLLRGLSALRRTSLDDYTSAGVRDAVAP